MSGNTELVGDERRLVALRVTELLDAPQDTTFDQMTRLICTALKVPVSLVSLVDADRQFFLSQCGLPEALSNARETPLSHSFCQHVVNQQAPLIVNDARLDPLVKANPAIRDLGVIAYLGVPVRDRDGAVLGSLCAIDTVSRDWADSDVALLTAFSKQLTVEIGLRTAEIRLRSELASHRDMETDRRAVHRLNIHDLRTPLSAMLLGFQVMEYVGDDPEEMKASLAMCKRNGATMLEMINRLLDIDIIDQRGEAALHREVLPPARVIHRALEQVRPLAEEKKVALKVDDTTNAPNAFADADKVERVLVNLLANAIKFTQAGGEARVSARPHPDDAHCVHFMVKDTGIGIENCEHLFEEGFRVDPAASSRRSTGLGLTFCKRIVEAHRGRIWLESQVGLGSTFHFILPSDSAHTGQACAEIP